jgi:hypothetical protein
VNVFARCHDKQSGDCGFVTQEELNRCQDNVEHQLAGKISNFAFFFLFFFKVVSGCLLDVSCVSLFVLLICLLCLVCCFLMYVFFFFQSCIWAFVRCVLCFTFCTSDMFALPRLLLSNISFFFFQSCIWAFAGSVLCFTFCTC